MIENLFILLRLGLDTSTIEKENLSDFIMLPAEKWAILGDLARSQGVLGFVLDGIDKLESTRFGLTRELQVNQKLEWIGEVLQIEQKNERQITVMNAVRTRISFIGRRVQREYDVVVAVFVQSHVLLCQNTSS